jgi:hypothetical protein
MSRFLRAIVVTATAGAALVTATAAASASPATRNPPPPPVVCVAAHTVNLPAALYWVPTKIRIVGTDMYRMGHAWGWLPAHSFLVPKSCNGEMSQETKWALTPLQVWQN